MKIFSRFFIFSFALFCSLALLQSAEPKEELSSQDFLAALRKPLSDNTWGEITGRISYAKTGQEILEGELRVRVTFTPVSMLSQITLNDKNIYGFEQRHDPEEDKITFDLDIPQNETKPGLFDFGIFPQDLTFAFIYWDFIEELPRQRSRMSECRVMKLADPNGKDYVQVWFSAEYGFPMEAWWFHKGEELPWRRLELKGAKKFENGLWFVKEMRLDGKDWKTRVTFDFAQLKTVEKNSAEIE